MSMLYVLIPLALLTLAGAVYALIWAIRRGQFDDLDSHGWDVVLDEDEQVRAAAGEKERDSEP